ncbi:MAG: hypothetical protein ACOYI8_01785 [Christensenellales bacterium]|jgi:fructan beta-fructosidase
MKCRIEKRYLLLPVSETAQMKRLTVGENISLQLRLSASPDYIFPYDLRDYVGQELEIETSPQIDFAPVFIDTPDDTGIYGERYRPVAHFSPKRGWNNDPNGLIYYEGRYHMFFQHNPVDTVWNNMHWGHAVSDDLLRWTELEEALYPDKHGDMFSGSAIEDTENLTGLKENGHNPLLLYYTAACEASTQRLAYSVDGGITFRKYPRAMIECITPANRDPKIIYCEELSAYLMPIYLEGREFALYTSKDLLHWEKLQSIAIPEDDECPDIYPLSMDGKRFWVMTAAHDRYLVGDFSRGCFTQLFPTGRLHYGTDSYAAQTFSGIPNGRRIRIAWNRSPVPRTVVNGSMSTPHDMTLREIAGRPMLCANPIPEFAALRGEEAKGKDALPLLGRANDIVLRFPSRGVREISLMGLVLSFADGILSWKDASMPVSEEGGICTLRIVQDVHSVEIYAHMGEATMLLPHIADETLSSVSCVGAEITAWPLASIHGSLGS